MNNNYSDLSRRRLSGAERPGGILEYDDVKQNCICKMQMSGLLGKFNLNC